MQHQHDSAPSPDLRIVAVESLFPHEEHDSQRAKPLIEKMKSAETIINPPIVASIDASRFVILDGANRCHVFRHLQYPHILVQVASYDTGYVNLSTWNHVISDWDTGAFVETIKQLPDVEIHDGQDKNALAHIIIRSGQVLAIKAPVENTHERNAVLRKLVHIYQRNAHLYRTALNEPQEVWTFFPDAIAMAIFPDYTPADIIAAAKYQAYLPAGISRHIIQGRALKLHYPMSILRDENTRITEKNLELQTWFKDKLANRQVRYYAESTYQFDE